ncbi:unnamed protein product [Meloidogyne enterolobii]|uniref:Uncharacterized protein n=1 Tax=Meloidogyne enterolobii TaxID=390850 RepID=A0ACB0YLS3_MELEN
MKAKKRLPISQRCSSSFSFTSTFFFLNHNPSSFFFFFIQSFSHIPPPIPPRLLPILPPTISFQPQH